MSDITNTTTNEDTPATPTYGNSEHCEAEYKRLLAAAVAAGVVEPDAKPSKLAFVNGVWQVQA